MTQALEDHRVRQEVEKGLPKSIIKLLYECLESGGKTIRTTNAMHNSGGDFKSCVYSQKKNRNGKETTVIRGRFHRCRRCTNEKNSCLYLFEERFGYIMQPIPQDPREREVGVEYQPLAPGMGEDDDERENALLGSRESEGEEYERNDGEDEDGTEHD